jgi:hypothetical protein
LHLCRQCFQTCVWLSLLLQTDKKTECGLVLVYSVYATGWRTVVWNRTRTQG